VLVPSENILSEKYQANGLNLSKPQQEKKYRIIIRENISTVIRRSKCPIKPEV